jgi:isopenicillin-N N-acyltransferase-like protein
MTLKIIQESYIPAIDLYYPTGLEELRGIADGSSVSLEEIVMLNGRYDLGRLSYKLQKQNVAAIKAPVTLANVQAISNRTENDNIEECTSAFFFPETTASGDSLACQNWDMDSHLYHDDLAVYLEVHPDPTENRPSMFLLTEVGQLIRTGMNSAGLAVTANSILCTDDFVPVSHTDANGIYHEMAPKLVLPITLARRVFLEYDNFSDGLFAINSMPCHVSGNLHVSTAEGFGIGLEKTPTRVYRVYANADEGYVLHSNHILAEGYTSRDESKDRYPGGSSWFRLQRLERAIKKDTKKGSLTNDLIRAAFSDHLGYPESLCCHDIGKTKSGSSYLLSGYTSANHSTVANVIYNLTKRTITVCKGPPCKGFFEEFQLKEGRKGFAATFTGLRTVG